MKCNKSQNVLITVIIISFIKLLLLLYHNFHSHILPWGMDAAMYDTFAQSGNLKGITLWMDILAYLNAIGLYDRMNITISIQFISVFIIPLVVAKLILNITNNIKLVMLSVLFVSCYPSLYMYVGDIYRDIVMFLFFVILLYLVDIFFKVRTNSKPLCLMLIFGLFYISFGFRPYLGAALLLAFFSSYFYLFKNIKILFALYFISIIIIHSLGLLEPLLEYRASFSEINAGSTLGIDISNANALTVVPLFIVSYLGQFFGFFLINASAVLVFLTESIPIMYMLFKINFSILNNQFYRFLFYFIIIYNTVWVMANDNLGTATRLRIYSYLGILILYIGSLALKYKKGECNI